MERLVVGIAWALLLRKPTVVRDERAGRRWTNRSPRLGTSSEIGFAAKEQSLMEQSEWRLGALSPLDGRYGTQMKPYAAAFSEGALIRERFAVEVAWLKQLAALPELTELLPLTDGELAALDGWVAAFGSVEAESVKRIEAVTNHDVKAVEYYLKNRLVQELGWTAERAEFVHFAATSEDVNNLAYARMVRRALEEAWLPAAEVLVDDVRAAALQYGNLADVGPDARPTGNPDDAREGAGRLRRSLGAPAAVGAPGGGPGQMGRCDRHSGRSCSSPTPSSIG